MLEQVRVNMTQAINEGLICGLPNPSNMEGVIHLEMIFKIYLIFPG